jgi:hypothetical protein
MLPYGSATLIAPDRLLVAIGSLAPGAEFRVGPNPASPSQTIPIVRWIRIVQSDVDTVSLRGLPGPQGAMVAYLARPVVGVTPLPIGDLSRADIGARISVVGYGNAGGARQLGQMTLRAMPGDSAPRILYPDVGAYAADLKATWMGSFPQETILEYANHDWNARLGSDDAVIGGVTGDTAPPIGAGYLGRRHGPTDRGETALGRARIAALRYRNIGERGHTPLGISIRPRGQGARRRLGRARMRGCHELEQRARMSLHGPDRAER